jgi:ATP-dependent helicase Lhr and Lhr-like helicase
VEIAGVDPLNLNGVVTPGPRVPAVLGQKVVYLDGVPQVTTQESVEPEESALAS